MRGPSLTRITRGAVAALILFNLGFSSAPSSIPSSILARHGQILASPDAFPSGFRWCVATAAHQIEGDNIHSDWWEWENRPPACGPQGCVCKIRDCEKSGVAADHWNRLEEDTELLRRLGVQQYRLSIEWAKIEPRRGFYDEAAIVHYRREIELLQQAGIEPMITLHHFTLPLWLSRQGGWTWPGSADAFRKFTAIVYTRVAPGVRDWVTFNEPLVHLGGGYVTGQTPPGFGATQGAPSAEDFRRLYPAVRGLLLAHRDAYRELHRLARLHTQKPVRVGFAHHLRVFDPARSANLLDRLGAGFVDTLWNWMISDAIATGKLTLSVPFVFHYSETIEGLEGTEDFFGVNYYTRDRVRLEVLPKFNFRVEQTPETARNDLGWEIYPEGFYRVLKEVAARRPGLPVIVTENGLADRMDAKRTQFLRDHLQALHRAIQDGVPVEAYCHWSLLDNFEWIEGFGPRFGLYEVDYATQQRTLRPSGEVFSRMTRENRWKVQNARAAGR